MSTLDATTSHRRESAISAQTKTVLIVDDDPLVTQTIQHLLKLMDIRSLRASQWAEAMDALEHESPDLVLLDMRMPNVDGPTLLEFIRESGHKVPVVVVSASLSEVDLDRLRELGVKRFVPKPFSIEQLRGIIEDQLEGGETEVSKVEAHTGEMKHSSPPKTAVSVSATQSVLGGRWKPKAGIRRQRIRYLVMVALICIGFSVLALAAKLILTETSIITTIMQTLQEQTEMSH